MSGIRRMTELEVRLFTERNTLLAAAEAVVSCWSLAPDAGGLPVALDELSAAVGSVKNPEPQSVAIVDGGKPYICARCLVHKDAHESPPSEGPGPDDLTCEDCEEGGAQ